MYKYLVKAYCYVRNGLNFIQREYFFVLSRMNCISLILFLQIHSLFLVN